MTKPEDTTNLAGGSPLQRGVMPLVQYEKELARLLKQRKQIEQRRDAVQAQINTLRQTIADIERARKDAEEAKLSRPWQVKFMRGTPATSGRDIAMLVQYLTTQTSFAAIGRAHGISGGRVAQIISKVVRRLRNRNYWTDGSTAPSGWAAEEIRAGAEAWLSALRLAEERHNVS